MDVFANDTEALEKRRHDAALYEARMTGVVERLAGSRDGAAFIRMLLDESGVFKAVFPRGHADAAWREGRRSIGLIVLEHARQANVIETVMSMEKTNG